MNPAAVWKERVAIVTGASAGLGLALAETLAAAGTRVVLAARGVEQLVAASARIQAAGHDALAVPTDVTRSDDVERLVAQTIATFGRLDLLVNNAGRSPRGKLADTTPEQFAELMDLNLLSAVRATRAALPHLLAQRGSVVNIGSLAAKSAGPFLAAYPATKFALAAFSQQLRLEMGSEGLHVLLVCPGPIAREQPRERAAGEMTGVPQSALRPGGGVRTRALDPHALSLEILDACIRRRPELVRPRKARLLFALSQLSPSMGDWLVRRMMS